MTDIPTVKEELQRKTLEAMAEMTTNYEEKGLMSQESYYQGMTAINLVTCGLIDSDVSVWLSENLKKNIPNAVERRVFVNPKATILMQREMVGDSFDMIQIVEGTQKSTTKSFADADNPHVSCFAAFDKMCNQLIAKGFTEVGDK